MTQDALGEIQADIGALERLLRELPEERFLERMGLKSRLEEARRRLAAPEFEGNDTVQTEDIDEREEKLSGRILGILPESRAFECRFADARVVHGKVDRSVEDIAEFKRLWENVDAELSFRVVSIRTKERFVLDSAAAAPVDEVKQRQASFAHGVVTVPDKTK